MSVQLIKETGKRKDFNLFIDTYKTKLTALFENHGDEAPIEASRGLTPEVMRELLNCNPLSVFIPEVYGGQGAHLPETMTLMETSSYHSLALSLMMGINGVLFLQPMESYGSSAVKESVYKRFINEGAMGGLMITEPDFGSEALKMKTAFKSVDGHYQVSGTKHWAGLTGMADFWIITARENDSNGELGRDIGFFVHETGKGGIEVDEYFQNLGLYMLPYGRNKIDIQVPGSHRLQPKSTGVTMLLDMLHKSRLQFPGMATGYLRRMLDEALTHCKNRFVGGVSLFQYDQVKERLSQLQSYFTASSAMSYFTSSNVSLHEDASRMDIIANSIKTVVTDYMQAAAQNLLQLIGAKGYKLDHIAGRSIIDSRPFQIFEGSNDILYQQITESVLKTMRSAKQNNLQEFLRGYVHTSHAIHHFNNLFNFQVDLKMPQRKMVQLGQGISRLIAMNLTIELGIKGFNSQMISNTLKVIQQEINAIVTTYSSKQSPGILDDYSDGSNWQSYLSPSMVRI